MIDKLEKQLGEDYALINKSSDSVYIQIYRKSESGINPETYVEVIENEGNYHLYLVQRNKQFTKAVFEQKNEALFVSGIYAISKLGNQLRNEQVQNDILDLKPDDFSMLNNILVREVGAQYYSIMQEKVKVINLEQGKDTNLFNIYYLADATAEKKYLVTDRRAPNAFLVLYNFAIKLKNANYNIDKWNNIFMVNQEQIELAKQLYIGIK